MAKSVERFHGGEGAVAAGRGEGGERVGERLQVGEGDAGERLPRGGAEAGDVGAVGPPGVGGAAVEPDLDETVVGGQGLGAVRQGGGDGGDEGGVIVGHRHKVITKAG
jgi:hypothetical protein